MEIAVGYISVVLSRYISGQSCHRCWVILQELQITIATQELTHRGLITTVVSARMVLNLSYVTMEIALKFNSFLNIPCANALGVVS
jgi:hypothetical protein